MSQTENSLMIVKTWSGLRVMKESDLRDGLWRSLQEANRNLALKEAQGIAMVVDHEAVRRANEAYRSYWSGELHEYSDWAKEQLELQETRGSAAET